MFIASQQLILTCLNNWELPGIPCKHVVATVWDMQSNGTQDGIPENLMHEVYRLSTWERMYNFKVNPINGASMWPKSECPFKVMAPKHHVQVGRPKKKRMRSIGEEFSKATKLPRMGKTVTCEKCKKQGHNSRTCKGQDMKN